MPGCANPYHIAANPGHPRIEVKNEGFLYIPLLLQINIPVWKQ
jgi:hypothetical protein